MPAFMTNPVEMDDDSEFYEVITLMEERVATHENEDICQQLCDRLNSAMIQWQTEHAGATLCTDSLED